MKKKFFAVILVALALSVFFAGFALAQPNTDDDIAFAVTVNPPSTLPPAEGEFEEITVDVVITNNSPVAITNIKVYMTDDDGQECSATLDSLSAGATSEKLSFTAKLSAASLGVDKPLYAVYTPEGEEQIAPVSLDPVKVNKIEPELKVNVTVIPYVDDKKDVTVAADGSNVKFSYKIENIGNIAITQLSVQENMSYVNSKGDKTAIDTTILQGEVSASSPLAPGASVTVTGHTASLTNNIEVAPVVTFSGSGLSDEKKPTAVTVEKYNPKVDFNVTVKNTSVAYGSKTMLTFTVKNTGNVALSKFNIKSDSPKPTKFPTSLAVGEKWSKDIEITVTSTKNHKYSFSAETPDGKAFTASSNVTVNMKPAENSDIKAEMIISADKLELSGPGKVVFTIEITNNSNFEIGNIQIKDSRDQDVCTIGLILSDGTQTRQHEMEISETEDIFFCAYIPTSSDDDAPTVELVSEEITVTVVEAPTETAPIETPTPTAPSESVSATPSGETSDSQLGIIDILIIGFIVILVLVALAVGALITINVMDKKKKLKSKHMSRKIK